MNKELILSLVNRLCGFDIEEFSIFTELDLVNQRVISIDVARTKTNILSPEEKITLETMLTFYCKTEKISYKQGMNEIFKD